MIRVGSGEKEATIMECGTINIEEEEPDESETRVENVRVSKYGDFGAKAEYTFVNEIVSGDGQSLTPTAILEVDGESVDGFSNPLEPGETTEHVFEITDLEPGSHEICVRKR